MADMWPYWFLLLVPLLFASLAGARGLPVLAHQPGTQMLAGRKDAGGIALMLYAVVLILMVGWRHEVGADWLHYLAPLDLALNQTWLEGAMVIAPSSHV